jgi:CRP-like cAMP-binding protein
VSEPRHTVAPDLWRSFVELGRPHQYAKGTSVFVEGDPPGDVYGVVSGHVKLAVCTRDGREVAVSYKQEGELFGELAAIDGLPRSATAEALDDVTVVAVAPREFMAFVERTPALAVPLLRMLAHRLRSANNHQMTNRSRSALERVAAGLVDLADRNGVAIDGRATVRLRHDDLAAWAGVNREAVSRALGRLRTDGLVATSRGEVELLDLPALRALGDGGSAS